MTMAIEPPAIYLPYDGPLIAIKRRTMEVRTICYGLGLREFGALGCQLWAEGGCLIVIPIDDDGSIKRHEEAHCNGWRH